MCNLFFKVNIKRGKMGPQIWNGHQNPFVKYSLAVEKKNIQRYDQTERNQICLNSSTKLIRFGI